MLQGHGNTSAKLILIADGGSQHDVECGYALSGYDERVLRTLFRANSLSFDECYRTAFIKERINLKSPKDNFPLVTDQYKEVLINEIRSISPNILVPLSELSFEFLTNLKGIRKFRGSILPGRHDILNRPIRVIPILGVNPYINEDPKQEVISRLDFSKVASNLDRSDPIQEIGNCWIAKTAESFRNFKKRNTDAQFLVFDIETFLDIPTCISFCFDGQESVCIPLIDSSISLDARVLLWGEVAELLRSEIPKVNQNIKFDWKKLARLGFIVNNVVGDTQIGAGVLYAEFPKNLGFLTSIYTSMPYFKDEGKDFDPAAAGRDKLYIYCAKDSLATHQIKTKQEEEFQETGTAFVYSSMIQILPIYKQMEETGILIDDTARKALRAKYESIFAIYLNKIRLLVGESEFNPLSPKQVSRIIFDELKFKPTRGLKRTKSGGYSTDEDSLELLAWTSTYTSSRDGVDIAKSIVAARKLHKVIELLELADHPDGRFHYEYNLGGAETGRTTSSSTSDYLLVFDKKTKSVKAINVGHGIQNIGKHGFTIDGVTYGKDLRSIFVPSRGYNFVECDLSQAEARVDAVLANDLAILDIFDKPPGIHKLTGSWVFECDPAEILKDVLVENSQGIGEDRYHLAKTVRHAAERNMREDRLMLMIHRPIHECIIVLKRVHDNQPNLRQVFHREIREQIQKFRNLHAPNGRKRDFFGRIDDHTINEGISFIPQAIVSDQLKFSLRKTFDQIRYSRPLAEAHDGFLSEVECGREVEYAQIFKKNIETPIDFSSCSLSRDVKLVIPMEAAMSNTNWMELKDMKI